MLNANIDPTIGRRLDRLRFVFRTTEIFFFLMYFLIADATNRDVFSAEVIGVTAALFSLFALTWFIAGKSAPTPLARPVLLLAIAVLICTVTSIDIRRSISGWIVFATGWFIFSLSADLKTKNWPIKELVGILLLIGGSITAIAMTDPIQWYMEWLNISPGQFIPELTYRLPFPNSQAWTFNMFLMLALAVILIEKSRPLRSLAVVVAIIQLVALVLSSSRGGWLGTAAGAGMMLFIWAFMNRNRLRDAWTRLLRKPIVLVLILVAGLVIAALAGWILLKQSEHPTHGGSITSARTAYWGAGLAAFKENPLTGTGPLTMATSFVKTQSTPPFGVYIHAHSLIFNVLGETGLLGFGAMLVLLFAGGTQLYRRLKTVSTLPPTDQIVLIAATAALAAALVHQIFDFLLAEKTAGLWVLLILLGLALGQSPLQSDEIPCKRKRRPYTALIAPLLLWACYFIVSNMQAGVAAVESQQYFTAVQQFEKAAGYDPHSAAPYIQLGLVESKLAQLDNPSHIWDSVDAFSRAVAIDPDWALNHANLAAMLMERGDFAEARDHWRKAVALAPRSALFQLNLGVVSERLNDEDAARGAYAAALKLAPIWAEAEFWRQSDVRIQVMTQWRADHPQPNTFPSIIDLKQRAETSGYAMAALNDLARSLLNIGRAQEALKYTRMAELTFSADPYDLPEARWLHGQALADLGQTDKACLWGRAALYAWKTPGLEGPDKHLGQYYVQMAFRQPAIPMDLVPQMARIGLTDEWEMRQTMVNDWCDQYQTITTCQKEVNKGPN